jgi:hypothetical protein
VVKQFLPEEVRSLLIQQIDSLRSIAKTLRDVLPSALETRAHRRPIAPELASLFRPEAPAEIPTWIQDDILRSHVTEASMRCPPGCRIYATERSIGCAIPGVPGHSAALGHGLTLHFRSTGRLSSQSFYERGLLRWAIHYHFTGGRDTAGFYASTEPKTYVEQGVMTRWSPNGTIVSQASYVGGIKHGWERLWEEDGHPIVATRYANGQVLEQILPDGSRSS